jgi:hypothetical protein
MRNLNEDLKPIGYYMKDRERMLHEMFRCVRGHKLQAILPDALKVTLRKFYDYYWYYYDYYKKKLLRRNFFILFFSNIFWSHFHSYKQVRLIIDPCFRLIYIELSGIRTASKLLSTKVVFFREFIYIHSPIFQIYNWEINPFSFFCNILIYRKYICLTRIVFFLFS